MGPAQVCAGEVVADMVQMSLEAHEVAIQRPSQAAGKATSAVQGVVAVNCAAGGAVGVQRAGERAVQGVGERVIKRKFEVTRNHQDLVQITGQDPVTAAAASHGSRQGPSGSQVEVEVSGKVTETGERVSQVEFVWAEITDEGARTDAGKRQRVEEVLHGREGWMCAYVEPGSAVQGSEAHNEIADARVQVCFDDPHRITSTGRAGPPESRGVGVGQDGGQPGLHVQYHS